MVVNFDRVVACAATDTDAVLYDRVAFYATPLEKLVRTQQPLERLESQLRVTHATAASECPLGSLLGLGDLLKIHSLITFRVEGRVMSRYDVIITQN